MTRAFSLFTLTLFLIGCGQTEEAEAPSATTPPADTVETSSIVAVETPSPMIADFVWNKTASDMTDEELAAIVTRWNARIDSAGYEMVGANILKPQFEEDRYDFIWVLMWPSSEAREAAWADWNANQLEAWTAELDGALSYDEENIYTFKPAGGWDSEDIANLPQGGTFIPSWNFCRLNDGYDAAALTQFRNSYDAGLAEGGATNYGYYIMEPQFDIPDGDVDFVWLDLFSDEAAMQEGTDAWTGSASEKSWNEMTNCDNYTFAATAIRR